MQEPLELSALIACHVAESSSKSQQTQLTTLIMHTSTFLMHTE